MTISVCRSNGEQLPGELQKKLTAAAHHLLVEHHLGRADVTIILADDSMLQELNLRYCRLDCPTDVLSFPMLEGDELEGAAGEGEGLIIGDIYISLDRACEQAGAAGHSCAHELLVLAVHGLLHLLGYDHDSDAHAAVMEQKEVETLNLLESPGGGQ